MSRVNCPTRKRERKREQERERRRKRFACHVAFTMNYDLSYYSNMVFLWHLMRLITGLAIQLNYGVSRKMIGLKARSSRANLYARRRRSHA